MNLLIASTAGAAGAATAASAGSATALVWAILLLGVAITLVFIELFVPSGGLISVVAGVALVGSVAAFFSYDTRWGFAAAGTYLVLAPMAAVMVFKFWTHSRIGRRLVLGGEDEDFEADAETAAAKSEHARKQRLAELAGMVGLEGTAETPLRPVGTVRIDGRRRDALAESGVIDAGSPVVVVAVHDNQLKVRLVR
jgi:membrane-bound serine protease (ClpP class)